MKFVILHLSDLHLKVGDNLLEFKLTHLANAFQREEPDVKAAFVVVSGDIAYSGLREEYENANRVLGRVCAHLEQRYGSGNVLFIGVPGNHDCDFGRTDSVRELTLQSIRGGKRDQIDERMTLFCSCVQDNFFEFMARFPAAASTNQCGRIYWEHLHKFEDGTNVVFRCYNTAWMSERKEIQGSLYFPLALANPSPKNGDYTVAVFHHPYNWMPATSYREFRSHIEGASDLILTGHEHEPEDYLKFRATGESLHYLEGAVLQDSSNQNLSGFHCVFVDTTAQLERVVSFSWGGDLYIRGEPILDWRHFKRGRRSGGGFFQLSSTFLEWIENPGATFQHPVKGDLRLDDIYVPPNLKEFQISSNSEFIYGSVIESADVIAELTRRKHVLVFGRQQSGKSTLAKVLFAELFSKGVVPVLVSGSELDRSHLDDQRFNALVEEKFTRQFSDPLLPHFQQLEAGRSALIVDDFDEAKLNAKGRLKLLDALTKRYERIIIFGDDVLKLEEVATAKKGGTVFASFEQLEILQFGYLLRSKLIEKWYSIGSEYVADPYELQRREHQAEELITVLLGRNYLPAYPIYILSFLQAHDTAQAPKGSAGTYGALYEVLITQALAKKTGAASLNTKLTYLSELAFHLFTAKRKKITDAEWMAFHADYCVKYKFKPNRASLIDDFRAASVITLIDDRYAFQHPAVYYYFVARHVKDNIADQTVKELITSLLRHLNTEEHVSIWLFLTHLSKDPFIVEVVTTHAKQLFSSFSPARFEEDVTFLREFSSGADKIVLRDSDFAALKETRLRRLDAVPQVPEEIAEDAEYEKETNETLLLIGQLTEALRTLEVLGQLVKNFPGSLVGQDKHALIIECYRLGLRCIAMMFSLFHQNVDEFVDLVADRIISRTPDIKDRETFKAKLKRFMFWMVEATSFGMIKRISLAAGHPDLTETYSDVLKELGSNAAALVDISIKLDHVGFPEEELQKLSGRFENNVLCGRVLKQLVVEHFYLFPTKIGTKQKVCAALGIPIEDIRQIDLKAGDQRQIES